MKVNKSLLAVLSMFLILLVFVSSASAADVNSTDVLSVDESTSTVNEKLALDYSQDTSESNDTNVIENDKEILQVANSEDDVLCGSIKTFNYNPKEILIGDTITIEYVTSKYINGDINITLGDYSQVYKNYPFSGTVLFSYEGTQMGELTGVFTFTDVASETSTQTFQVTVNGKHEPKTIYVNSSADSDGNGSEASPFRNLKDALNNAFAGDTIMVASGEYKGKNNVGLSISKSLNLIKYGDDEVVFNAEKSNRILTVAAKSTNITGLTFKNGVKASGGAIIHNSGILSLIDCTFDDCKSLSGSSYSDGGAIYSDGTDLIISRSSFNNCEGMIGGVICGNSVSATNCTFNNNTAHSYGGAIYANSVSATNCAFTNNTGDGSAIYAKSSASIENDWWGSNNPNWDELIYNIETPSVYAVLNVIADPTEIDTSGKSDITTKFIWNGTNTDATSSLPKRNVKLSSNGTLTEIEGDVGLTSQFSATTDGIYYVNATVDNETLGVYVNVIGSEPISTNITVNTTSLDLSIDEIGIIEARLNPSEAGELTVNYDEKIITLKMTDGIWYVTPKAKGNTTITFSFPGSEGYAPAENKTVTVTVSDKPSPSKKDLNLSATAEPIIAGQNVTIIVTGFENATGDVTARIEGGALSTPIVNGTATFIVPGITSSTTATIYYAGDDNYNSANTTVDITVIPKTDVNIIAENVTKYYGGPERFVAKVYDSELNPIANKTVSITINRITYTRTTDENGTVSLAINLGSGTYGAIIQVDSTSVKSYITVLSTLTGNDIIKYYRNATQYSVQVFDTTGKAVGAGKVVTFNVNGRFYNRTTDENGIATLNINLPQGEYVITAINPVTGEMHSNNINVLPVVAAEDITMKYLDGTQFVATLVDGQGNPYKDKFVTFNVNGILYNRVTDSNGQAALNIRLPPGEYIITSSFNGCNIANKITITG